MKAYREKVHFDFVLMLGDNIYPHGEAALFKPRFEEPYKDLLKDGVKFYASLGNHDLELGPTPRCITTSSTWTATATTRSPGAWPD